MIGLSGTISASSLAEADIIRSHLPRHIRLTRNELGCLRFDAQVTDDPFVWQIDEVFLDEAAFQAHQTRNQTSEWYQVTAGFARSFTKFDAQVQIRDEEAGDTFSVLSLLAETFDGVREARLLQNLREDGDLAHSLVADAGGAILGHLALSRLRAEHPALALAPLAVLPRAQRRGIASALIGAAIARAQEQYLVVLGEPDFYSRFGFNPVAWESPFAGPCLQARGHNLPLRNRISPAPAFESLS
ncbi:GNAT family N-acetyltransferase [Paracoccus sp. (in: a-proteobacteria)]|uniref:GNAT family N-acetyltransferase n=1 Tax=Paracoccus sp. TaxID=267 RepID=UPI00289DE9FB|nr:GNAT family N-acetyltransferase [Paracoccus sp. (in: a-proteobacteria)]